MSFEKSWRTLAQSLMGKSEFTSREVAAQAGVDLDQARQLWRSLGFPPVPDEDRVFTRSDTEMLSAASALLDQRIAEPHVLLQFTRVIGQTLGRLAEAQVSATTAGQLRDLVGGRAAAEDAMISATETLVPILEPFIGYAWRRHLMASLYRHRALAESVSSGEQILVVGFADLVGFTAASQALDESELAAVVDRFAALAYEHIPAHGGRVVKMIGDEVMFAAESSFNAAEIALSLIEAFSDDESVPDVRVGLALGRPLSWEGDLFGPTVNLASRLVNLAYPGTALVSEELHEELLGRPNFFLRGLRHVRLKGIGRTRTWVLRRGRERNLWHFMCGRGVHEKVYGELKAGFAFDCVPTMRYAANSVWQLLSVLAFNLMSGFQVITTASRRSRTRKRNSLHRFETIHTLRYLYLHHAGLVLYPDGRPAPDEDL